MLLKQRGNMHNWVVSNIAGVYTLAGSPPVPKARQVLALDDLLQAPPGELARLDIAFCNLLCASGLPGAEEMDVPQYMRRLDEMTDLVRRKTERDLPRFRENRRQFGLPGPCTENFFRVVTLVSELKFGAGIHYNPRRRHEHIAPFSAKDMLINGLLSDERVGTCNTIPILIVAVGRRLGYPLHVSATSRHVWARWDGQGERFNIEASCDGGFNDYDDDHFRSFPEPMNPIDVASGYYLRNLTPVDEVALALFSRAWVLDDHKRYEESLPAWARCCFLAPGDPMYPRRAYDAVYRMLHVRKFGRPCKRGPDGKPITDPDFGDLSKLLSSRELGMFWSVQAHFHEATDSVGEALLDFRNACDSVPTNPDYRADRERYLRRLEARGIPKRRKPGVSAPSRNTELLREAASTTPRSPERRNALRYEAVGLEAERMGLLPESQAAFAQADRFSQPEETRNWVHLHRVVRREIAEDGMPPLSVPDGGSPAGNDPRLALPPDLQAMIWYVRGRVLECDGRFIEAVKAHKEAVRLAHKVTAFRFAARSVSQWQGARRRASKAQPTQDNSPKETSCSTPK